MLFLFSSYCVHGSTHYRDYLAVVISLHDIVESPVLDSLYSIRDVAVGSEEDNLGIGSQWLQFLYHVHPVAIGEEHVAQHHLHLLLVQYIQSRGTVLGFEHLISFQFQYA